MSSGLSARQRELLAEISQKWYLNAYTRKEYDKPLIEDYLDRLYRLYRIERPDVVYANGPLHCQELASQFQSESGITGRQWNNIIGIQMQYEIELQLNRVLSPKTSLKTRQEIWSGTGEMRWTKISIDQELKKKRNQIFEGFSPDGMRAADWCAYNDFFRVSGLVKVKDFDRYREFILRSGIFFSIYAESCVIVCQAPNYFMLNEDLKLHNTTGPAIEWEDGFRLYYLKGLPISEVFFLPADEIDPVLLLKEKNAEVRREIIRKLGIEKVVKLIGARVVDRWGSYELLTLNIPDMNIKPTYLKMLNPSVGIYHLEGVPPEIKTCKEALAWRDGEEQYIIPRKLT